MRVPKILCFLFLLVIFPLFKINTQPIDPSFSIGFEPFFALPAMESADLFKPGGAVKLGGEYGFTGNPQAFLTAGLDYTYLPVNDEDSSLSFLTMMGGGGFNFWFTPRFSLKISGATGYYYGFLNDMSLGSGQIVLDSNIGVEYILTPDVNLSIGGGYRYSLGTYQGYKFSASTTFFLKGTENRRLAIAEAKRKNSTVVEAKTPKEGQGIEISRLEFEEIFPVFYKYYDARPVGSALLQNLEKEKITDIKLSFFIKRFMDSPKESPVPKELAAGERMQVDIMSLLSDRVLDVTEATMVAGEISLDYRISGELYRDVRTITLRVLDRNAMTWDDDRKAAAFITAKDPAVMGVSRTVAGLVRENAPKAMNPNLAMGMGMFDVVELYGITYVIDPRTPFVEYSENDRLVDYLQFPRQTLEFRGGDCDDLSILFSALLESVGIETALVTVPGHILMAFSTGLDRKDASMVFSTMDNIIVENGEAWIPVETTVRRGGFMKAWSEGARQWQDAQSRGAADFLPVHEAWRDYEPVGLPGEPAAINLPEAAVLSGFFEKEVDLYVERELSPRIAALEARIRGRGGNPQMHNRLGILYARYDRFEDAQKEFQKALEQEQYVPAMLNLGNLLLIQGSPEKALTYFEEAHRLSPNDPKITLVLSMAYRQADQRELSLETYEKLAVLDKTLAEKHSYLGSGSLSGGRAAEVDKLSVLLWFEE